MARVPHTVLGYDRGRLSRHEDKGAVLCRTLPAGWGPPRCGCMLACMHDTCAFIGTLQATWHNCLHAPSTRKHDFGFSCLHGKYGARILSVMRLCAGCFESGCFPGSFYHLSLFFTSLEVGFAYATVASSTALSNVIGAPLAAGILYMDGLGGLRVTADPGLMISTGMCQRPFRLLLLPLLEWL